nr:hypothetical protein [Tanacetum cinerariifolium]
MEECHKLLTDSVDDSIIRHNASKLLPLGGPPGHVTVQSDFFFNKDLKYLKYGSKGSRPALSISNMKPPTPPPPAGPSGTSGSLGASRSSQVPPPPPLPPSTNQEGQSHGSASPSSSKTAASAEYKAWTMTDTRLRHTSEGDRRAVRTHMRILSVVRIEVFSMYRYDYMKKIILRRADLNEHIIANGISSIYTQVTLKICTCGTSKVT